KILFFFSYYGDHRNPHSFPTRRSSDLLKSRRFGSPPSLAAKGRDERGAEGDARREPDPAQGQRRRPDEKAGEPSVREADRRLEGDRKSTRLNSSHVAISYAVFCLKKKK